jgi:hypothetical protein
MFHTNGTDFIQSTLHGVTVIQRVTKDLFYFETWQDNAPTLRVEPSEEFEVETQINRGPWFDDHPDAEALKVKLRGGNPTSGCLYVEGRSLVRCL